MPRDQWAKYKRRAVAQKAERAARRDLYGEESHEKMVQTELEKARKKTHEDSRFNTDTLGNCSHNKLAIFVTIDGLSCVIPQCRTCGTLGVTIPYDEAKKLKRQGLLDFIEEDRR